MVAKCRGIDLEPRSEEDQVLGVLPFLGNLKILTADRGADKLNLSAVPAFACAARALGQCIYVFLYLL